MAGYTWGEVEGAGSGGSWLGLALRHRFWSLTFGRLCRLCVSGVLPPSSIYSPQGGVVTGGGRTADGGDGATVGGSTVPIGECDPSDGKVEIS